MCLNEACTKFSIGKNLSDAFPMQNDKNKEMLYRYCFQLWFGMCHQEGPKKCENIGIE